MWNLDPFSFVVVVSLARACVCARPRTLPHQQELKEKALLPEVTMLSDVGISKN